MHLFILALIKCGYYVTSETEYRDYFSFDEVATTIVNDTQQIRFFTLTPTHITFKLAENDSSDGLSERLHRFENIHPTVPAEDDVDDGTPNYWPPRSKSFIKSYEIGSLK